VQARGEGLQPGVEGFAGDGRVADRQGSFARCSPCDSHTDRAAGGLARSESVLKFGTGVLGDRVISDLAQEVTGEAFGAGAHASVGRARDH